jgi:hypothetical protein
VNARFDLLNFLYVGYGAGSSEKSMTGSSPSATVKGVF